MAPSLILDFFEILRHNFLVDWAIDTISQLYFRLQKKTI